MLPLLNSLEILLPLWHIESSMWTEQSGKPSLREIFLFSLHNPGNIAPCPHLCISSSFNHSNTGQINHSICRSFNHSIWQSSNLLISKYVNQWICQSCKPCSVMGEVCLFKIHFQIQTELLHSSEDCMKWITFMNNHICIIIYDLHEGNQGNQRIRWFLIYLAIFDDWRSIMIFSDCEISTDLIEFHFSNDGNWNEN
jgi:hypothetical protein